MCFWDSEIEEPLLCLGGTEKKLWTRSEENGAHTALNVYRHMMIAIPKFYNSAPDVRTMTLDELEFFYDGIRCDIMDAQKAD